MHELSIAQALLDVAGPHLPPRSRARRLTVEVGPLQAIDASAMQWAWEATRPETPFAAADLELTYLRWHLECPRCGQTWEADAVDTPCRCGAPGRPIGGDELRLIALEVDVEGDSHESARGRECSET